MGTDMRRHLEIVLLGVGYQPDLSLRIKVCCIVSGAFVVFRLLMYGLCFIIIAQFAWPVLYCRTMFCQ